MSLIGSLKNFGQNVGLASLGLPGLAIARSRDKAAKAKAAAGDQPAGKQGLSAGSTLLRSLLGLPGLLLK